MAEPYVAVGFDYSRALLELRNVYTYAKIAEFCGYAQAAQIGHLIRGHIPNHPRGEAIYALYLETFNRKPPMAEAQRAGGRVAIGGAST